VIGGREEVRGYFAASRAPRYSLLFALPLLVAYEALAATLPDAARTGLRNGADVLLQRLFVLLAGTYGPLVFWTALIVVSLGLVVRDARRHRGDLSGRVFAGMLLESAALAVACGVVVGAVTTRLLGALAFQNGQLDTLGWPTRLMLSLGAGLYEELLFRVLLVGLLAWLARGLFGWRPLPAGAFAVVIGAFVFSGFHYVGPYGDRLELFSFTYRTIAGLFFSALYLLRGFGITAWTHALYDVIVLVIARG
jgi:hypothetical protein